MEYIRPLKERLRTELDKLMIIYGIGEHETISFRQVKTDMREDIKAILKRQGAADNTAIDIYMEDDIFVVRVGEDEHRWN